MRSVSDVLHNSGGLMEYTTKAGKVLKIKFLDLKAMSEYENKLQNRAIQKLASQRSAIPEDIFTAMFSELMDKISAGVYAFGNTICNQSLSTVQGISDLVSILCSVPVEEAMELIVAEGEAFKTVFDHVVRKSVSSPEEDEQESPSEKKS